MSLVLAIFRAKTTVSELTGLQPGPKFSKMLEQQPKLNRKSI